MADNLINPAKLQEIRELIAWPNQRQGQIRIVTKLQERLDQKCEFWMNRFIEILISIVILIMSCLTYEHYTNPWGMKCYAYFNDKQVEAEMIAIVDAVAVIACVKASYAFSCFCKHKKPNLLISIFLGFVTALFWLYYMLRAPKFRWDLIWLPMTPSCCLLVSWYVDYLLDECQDAIDKLAS